MTAAFAFTSRDDDRYETKSAASATVHTGHFGKILSKKCEPFSTRLIHEIVINTGILAFFHLQTKIVLSTGLI